MRDDQKDDRVTLQNVRQRLNFATKRKVGSLVISQMLSEFDFFLNVGKPCN